MCMCVACVCMFLDHVLPVCVFIWTMCCLCVYLSGPCVACVCMHLDHVLPACVYVSGPCLYLNNTGDGDGSDSDDQQLGLLSEADVRNFAFQVACGLEHLKTMNVSLESPTPLKLI